MASRLSPSIDPRNTRKHGQRSREAIACSLRELGAGRSIVLDRDGVVVAGNGVFEQADRLNIPIRPIDTDGSTLVVVVRDDLASDDPRRKALALADNRLGELSSWDQEKLDAARLTLDAELLAAAAAPPAAIVCEAPEIPPVNLRGEPEAGFIRFSFGGFRTDLADTTYQKIIDSIPNNGSPSAVVEELMRRIGL
jgi:hypothetical protein